MRVHPRRFYNPRIKPNKEDSQMDKVLETILTWLNPINAAIFLVGFGTFVWLVTRTGRQDGK
jgi:hypothetical protein